MVLDFIFDLVLMQKRPKFWENRGKKKRFFGFYCLKYFEFISVKTKAFRNFFFIKMFRIKSSTNAENFVKIGDHFCTSWSKFHGNTLQCFSRSIFHRELQFSKNWTDSTIFFMHLNRANKGLSNEYKMFEMQVATSLHISLTKYSTSQSIIIFIIFFHIFSIPFMSISALNFLQMRNSIQTHFLNV